MKRPVVHTTAWAYHPTPCIFSTSCEERRVLCGSAKNIAPTHTAIMRMCTQMAIM
jgi:hypothetical protein